MKRLSGPPKEYFVTVVALLMLACDGGIAVPFAGSRSGPQSLQFRAEGLKHRPPQEPRATCEAEIILPEKRVGVRPQYGGVPPWSSVTELESRLDSVWADPAFLRIASQPIAIDEPVAIVFIPHSMRIKRVMGQDTGVGEFIGQWRRMADVADSIGLALTPRANDGLRLGLSPHEWIDVVMPWQCYGVLTAWPDEPPLITFGPIEDERIARVLGQHNFALRHNAL